MSETSEPMTSPQDAFLALFLQENDGDGLTDILVAALRDAFVILGGDLSAEPLH